ncbi:LysM peptidoglycan-binding domain-containing protein [Vibrio aestuarianus]|uniref:LysM peptidoglycan-binding domain-containing protein n=2 Tax=Vibrio TaxID=662 RepID=A0A9X4FD85_9VIBR|nr:LysM domain-containing protein [Vibrio aestuarianus]MDE1236469.1 LysM peptidoglycan-binding domain-containing protein [Vibrio aestuarianus]MDE1247369.1 LysM peptidoglycan-binding domain-containing protein [Vibrio aestuarianus]MDE1347750.1 LysM peptidoglycan-binding domain-containing protein [Vibrio aestuarianus]NGZ64519.1 LysM peptidoglycan-binding domain-containing protein [Vibrio aestuarianus subsp. cardii]
MSSHIIQPGDTLSVLAKRYNTDIKTLQQLNAQQIKDIDLIYNGNTLVLPEVYDLASGEREAKQILSNDLLTLSECSVPQFVDALYVPEHPNTRKQMLILLTEEAKKYVLEDNQRCKAALQGDKETVLKQLTKLGVMDQFNSIAHEAFLKHIDEQKAKDYREALLEHMALSYCYQNDVLQFPLDNERIGLSSINSRQQKIEERYEDALRDIEQRSQGSNWLPIGGMMGEIMLTKDAIAGAENHRVAQLKKLQKSLIKQLEKSIQRFEKEAMDFAAKTSLEEQGKHYQFSDKHAYYTSNVELKIYNALETIKEERKKIGLCDDIDSADLTISTEIPSLKAAYESYQYWQGTAHTVLNRLMNLSSNFDPRAFFNITSRDNRLQNPDFYAALYRLNQTGVVLKEQCLTEDQLFKGWEQVEQVRIEIKEQRASIADLQKLLNSIERQTPIDSAMGYYCVYVLNLLLLQEVALRVENFAERLGENAQYAQYVKSLLRYAEAAQQRRESLLALATQNVTPHWDYLKRDITFIGDVPVWDDSSRTVLVRETHWQPQNLNNQIFANSGINQRTVVECALSSDPTTALYILSDSPVLSSNVAENKKCTSVISLNLATSAAREKGKITAGLKKALGSESVLKSLKFEQTATWANVEDIVFPWQMKDFESVMFGINTAYETSGGAQFARYVYSAEAKVDHELIKADSSTLVKVELKAGLTLASAERCFTIRFPNSGSLPLDIPYRVRESNERRIKNIGTAVLVIEGKVYGVLGASLKLGTELHIGNVEESRAGFGAQQVKPLGIKGTVPNRADYSSYAVSSLGTRGSNDNAIGAGIKAEASAFAGLEAGGMLSCKYDWTKDLKSPPQNLFKVSQDFKMSLGIGYEGVLQCTFQNGRFIFITALGASAGLGIGGKFATELNPAAANDFFAALLAVMQNSGFQRFEFFDESGEVNTFAAFNTILTVAAAFGLTVGQVMMLPFNIISNMEKQASDKDNAYFVANFLLSEEHQRENQQWIANMPAETLAKLLSVLIHYNDIPSMAIFQSQREQRNMMATRNENQRKAINQILRWLGGEKANQTGMRRFENALQRMGLADPTQLDKAEQWPRYAKNVLSLRDFFSKGFSQPYENPNDQDKGKYMRDLGDQYNDFRRNINWLTKESKILEKVTLRSALSTEYTALPASDSVQLEYLKTKGYRLVNWLPEK